ncbi:MAG: peptidoglycan DD-metalloendopeptidase family protein, partial [Nocardioidaceae bacterium]
MPVPTFPTGTVVPSRSRRMLPVPGRLLGRLPGRLLGRLLGSLMAALLAIGTLGAGPASAVAPAVSGPDYEMPFSCGDLWNGRTYHGHSPSEMSIDWNRDRDLGAVVVAAAPGVVTSVVDLGNRSYGRYVVVDHGNGRTTLYAHLSAFWTTTGATVDQGTPIGLVGSSGGSTGPHLHFEERLDRRDHRAWFHRQLFVMGRTQASTNCGDAPVVGDWDGNGTVNVGVRRREVTPTFRLKRPGRRTLVVPFGLPTDQPVSGDWDGNGTTDVGVRRQANRAFLLRRANGTTSQVALGRVSDVAVTGDWNGDGRTDLGVWSPASRVFTLRAANGSTRTVSLGSTGDQPVTGDWNGDRVTDLGVWSSRTSTFTLRTVSRAGAVGYTRIPWGSPTAIPVAGDWNADGTGDVGAWDPATGGFALRLTPSSTARSVVTRRPRWG